MNEYYLFSGDVYYPLGGMKDYRGVFNTLDEAMVALANRPSGRDDWAHVAELINEELVKTYELEPIYHYEPYDDGLGQYAVPNRVPDGYRWISVNQESA